MILDSIILDCTFKVALILQCHRAGRALELEATQAEPHNEVDAVSAGTPVDEPRNTGIRKVNAANRDILKEPFSTAYCEEK